MVLDSRSTVAWAPTTVAWPFSEFFPKQFRFAWSVEKRCSIVGRWSRDLRRLSRDRSATFFLNFVIFAGTSKYNFMTVSRRSRDHRRLSRNRSATFSKTYSKRYYVPKTEIWQIWHANSVKPRIADSVKCGFCKMRIRKMLKSNTHKFSFACMALHVESCKICQHGTKLCMHENMVTAQWNSISTVRVTVSSNQMKSNQKSFIVPNVQTK